VSSFLLAQKAPPLSGAADARRLGGMKPGTPTESSVSFNPEAFAQRQLDAYNARDLDRFVAEYTDDVVVYRMPEAEPILVGKAALAEHYRKNRFALPDLHAELVNRMVFGNKVIDQERVLGVAPEPMEVAALYEVTPSGISKVWFLSGK
jgi:hypothetical protein